MRVIICGAGQVGWQIAWHLSGESNDVTIIDNDPDLVRRAGDTLDVRGLHGFASYPDVLENAGAPDADMIIAATQSDEVNMVVCQVAHSVFSIPKKIARLRAESYLRAIDSNLYQRDHMPIDVVISPEREVAEAALSRFRAPSAFDIESFLDGEAELLGISLGEDCPVVNTPLKQLSELFSTLRAVVVGVRRDKTIFAPKSADQLLPHDDIYLMSHSEDVVRALEIFGKSHSSTERAVIIGGGSVGLAVAKALENSPDRARVKVIERNRQCAELAADALERTIVINGDGLDREILAEAGIEKADAVLCVTDDDKANLLAAVRAKEAGCSAAICLVNDHTLLPLLRPMRIDAHINPRATTVSSILKHVRQGSVRAIYSIGDAEAEVIEAEVLSPSPIAGKTMREAGFPDGALVGALRKGGDLIRPSGGTRIDEGDIIVIFALKKVVPEVDRLLQVSLDYF